MPFKRLTKQQKQDLLETKSAADIEQLIDAELAAMSEPPPKRSVAARRKMYQKLFGAQSEPEEVELVVEEKPVPPPPPSTPRKPVEVEKKVEEIQEDDKPYARPRSAPGVEGRPGYSDWDPTLQVSSQSQWVPRIRGKRPIRNTAGRCVSCGKTLK